MSLRRVLFVFSCLAVGETLAACASPANDGQSVESAQALGANASSPAVFDWGYYLERYPDLGNHGIDSERGALDHWLTHGIAEGRQGAEGFNAKDYLETNDDIRAQHGTNLAGAIEHYVTYGQNEGRLGAPFDRLVFDWRYYVDANADLRAFDEAAARRHWITYGIDEGRQGARAFHAASYLAQHPDLLAAFGARDYRAAIRHWLAYGAHEGRRGAASATKAKQVGVMYSVWHATASSAQRYKAQLGHEPLTIADIIRRRAAGNDIGVRNIFDTDGLRGHAEGFIYANQPSTGYYSMYRKRANERSYEIDGRPLLDSVDTRSIARLHADQLVSAGVDFVYVDNTNFGDFGRDSDALALRPLEVLFEEWAAYRAEGHPTPTISVFAALPGGDLWARYLELYNRPEYAALVARDAASGKKLFFFVDGKIVGPAQRPNQAVVGQVRSNGDRRDILTVPIWTGRSQQDLSAGAAEFISSCRVGSTLGEQTTTISLGASCNQSYT